MKDQIQMNDLSGGQTVIGAEALEPLAAALRGTLLQEGDPGFDPARAIWNGMIDRKPSLIVQAAGPADIRAAVDFARTNGLRMAIRAGGHQIAGLAVEEGSMMLDLSAMRSVRVDAKAGTVRVEPGATLGDLDHETQAFGLAVPVGVNSTTGIAGLTLGGGFGWITRKYGMTIDNLISADVVLANGECVRASAQENPDLFWALRGGGGNFGVVSSFEFRAHPVGPEVLSGLVIHPFEAAADLLPKFQELCDRAPDDLTIWSVLRKAPPLPFLPEDWHGREVLIFAACYAGDMAEGEAAMRELRALGTPIVDVIGPHPFTGWQAAFDPLLAPGARNYWKSRDFLRLGAGTIGAILDAVGDLPDPQSEVFIAHVGGAMARVAADATAYPQRAGHFVMNVHTRWDDPVKDTACIDWARQLFRDTAADAAPSVYVNFMPEDEPDRLGEAYGGNMQRLQEIKARYDPGNLLRVNHNIRPMLAQQAAQ
ncbi:FAD-binding oxidoreductase [Pseudooceanicola nanhaiensis]|uniref:FAD-binding oxidoreductase n=1 Tax=Pseudooceanicola nanhaiensis TaxID=375761 RepID=UPI001CD6D66F|nr:FAD-binding oxidoreductase [Pseudooceanicola nanhaiensis]MCA0922814.1 FAD-binding oxidoreductase [Pseudooceanicola nanhaiensis]